MAACTGAAAAAAAARARRAAVAGLAAALEVVSRHAAASNIFFAPPLRTGIVADRESPVELCNAFLKPHLHKPNSDAVMSMR